MREFLPHVTVATVVESDGRYLLVEECREGKTVYNQPAGHLEAGESLQQAALRECLEETGWDVELTAFLGATVYLAPTNGVTYVRHTFSAKPLNHHPEYHLDEGIIAAHWLTIDEIKRYENQLRSPLVIEAIQTFESGSHLPLSAVSSLGLPDNRSL